MMAHLVTRHLAVLTLVAVALAVAPRADADPSALLADPGAFSGSETLLTFDDLGLNEGSDIPSVAGVEFTLSGGGPAKFLSDYFPREFGPQDVGSLNNFWTYNAPYPDLTIRFPAAMHRLSFEMRTNDADDLAVTLLASGEIVDEVTVPSRGSDQLYFYGFENPAGFDEVLLDVQANVSGALILDNLVFEELEDSPAEGPPVLSCVGFSSPLDALLADPRNARFAPFLVFWMSRSPVKMLRARLLDQEDLELGDADLIAPPVPRVLFTPADGEETQDVTTNVTWKDAFSFKKAGFWRLGFNRYQMKMPGTYLITMESGDASEYLIDPTCSESIVNKKHRKHHFKH